MGIENLLSSSHFSRYFAELLFNPGKSWRHCTIRFQGDPLLAQPHTADKRERQDLNPGVPNSKTSLFCQMHPTSYYIKHCAIKFRVGRGFLLTGWKKPGKGEWLWTKPYGKAEFEHEAGWESRPCREEAWMKSQRVRKAWCAYKRPG